MYLKMHYNYIFFSSMGGGERDALDTKLQHDSEKTLVDTLFIEEAHLQNSC